jgi:Fe-Mn family superoxide dismutase
MNDEAIQPEMNRRSFLLAAGGLCVTLGMGVFPAGCAQSPAPSSLSLPALPYKEDALEPVISRKTMEFHHGKHHRAYVDKTAELVKGTSLAGMSFLEIMKQTASAPDKVALFNNAAQAWNHDFFWKSLAPGGGGKPEGEMAALVEKSFGSYDNFKKEFSSAAVTQFGSGWAWLVLDGDKLAVVKTSNADNPILKAQKPLLTIDVWEHAYYLDYQNRRPDYVNAVLEKLLNWQFAASNLAKS